MKIENKNNQQTIKYENNNENEIDKMKINDRICVNKTRNEGEASEETFRKTCRCSAAYSYFSSMKV